MAVARVQGLMAVARVAVLMAIARVQGLMAVARVAVLMAVARVAVLMEADVGTGRCWMPRLQWLRKGGAWPHGSMARVELMLLARIPAHPLGEVEG